MLRTTILDLINCLQLIGVSTIVLIIIFLGIGVLRIVPFTYLSGV